jgi:hypothetical protein
MLEAILARGLHRDRRAAGAAAAGEREECESRDTLDEMLALVPTPIGVGPRYHPQPAIHAPCHAQSVIGGRRVHLELFAGRRVVIVPAAIGLRAPRRSVGRVVAARCRAAIWTLDSTGVIRFDGTPTLGEVFAVWVRAVAPNRLLTFRGAVTVFRNGARWRGDPRLLELRDGDQLVLEVGGYVPPHRSYLFPRH